MRVSCVTISSVTPVSRTSRDIRAIRSCPPLPVQRRSWFIGQDEGRVVHQRACDRDPLPLSAGELRGGRVHMITEADRVQHCHRSQSPVSLVASSIQFE
jgi:hypothetical protein